MAAKGFFTEDTELEKGGQASVVPHSLCPFTVLVTTYSARQVVCMHTYPHHLRLPFRPDPSPLSVAWGKAPGSWWVQNPPPTPPSSRPSPTLLPALQLVRARLCPYDRSSCPHPTIAQQQPPFPFQTGGRGYTRQAPWLSLWLTCVVCSNEWMAPLASETRAPESRLHPTD